MRSRKLALAFGLLGSVICACGNGTVMHSEPKAVGAEALAGTVPAGDWGGEHIALTLGASGGRLEYDCAVGTVTGAITPDAEGNFVAVGTHVFEKGGPRFPGDPPNPTRPARFTGWTDGKSMRLTVTLTDGAQTVGTFSLELGRRATLEKCL